MNAKNYPCRVSHCGVCSKLCTFMAGHLGLHSWAPDPWPRLQRDPKFIEGMKRVAEERAAGPFAPFKVKRP